MRLRPFHQSFKSFDQFFAAFSSLQQAFSLVVEALSSVMETDHMYLNQPEKSFDPFVSTVIHNW